MPKHNVEKPVTDIICKFEVFDPKAKLSIVGAVAKASIPWSIVF